MILRPTELQVGKIYHRRTEVAEEADSAACARLLGEEVQLHEPCLGIVFVWALRTLIESDILPPGAIMMGHEVEWLQPPPLTGPVMTEMSIVQIDPPRRRYRRVVIGYRSSDSSGADVAFQKQAVLWPS